MNKQGGIMKKYIVGLMGILLLSGCTSYEPDIDEAKAARDENHRAMRSEYGCPMSDDHATYRQCLLSTYARQSPHTFTTTVLEDGRPVAVISNATIMQSRGGIEKDVSAPQPQESWVTESVTVVETVETDAVGAAEPVDMLEPSVTTTVTTTEVATEETPQPQQDPTWWETYQQNRPPEDNTAEKGGCPCPDPNEPCPQCFDK